VRNWLEEFQSTPAIAGGRIGLLLCWTDREQCFNPRPPLLAGESRQIHFFPLTSWRFNPRPPLLAGESLSAEAGVHQRCFNPRPPLLAGEFGATDQLAALQLVSIHARHCWRANASRSAASGFSKKFQSTPAIAGGRIAADTELDTNRKVSIHARHCWRANALVVDTNGDGNVSIHARHCWRANETAQLRAALKNQFQSTPAIAGGRMPTPASPGAAAWFQSTPAIAGGRMCMC